MPTMPSRPSSGAVAPRRDAHTSPPESAEGDAAPPPDPSRPASPQQRPRQRRPRIVVARGVSPGGASMTADGAVPLDYPVQLSKVQAPPLRDDTLARDRLPRLAVREDPQPGRPPGRRSRLRQDDPARRFLAAHARAGVVVPPGSRGSRLAGVHGPPRRRRARARIGLWAGDRGAAREASTRLPSLDAVLDTFLRELGSLPPTRPCSCSTTSTWSTTRPT
jgi:hypothetical protein